MRDLLPHVDIPMRLLISTPFMVLLFVGIVWWVFKRDRQGIYSEIEKMPFTDEQESDL